MANRSRRFWGTLVQVEAIKKGFLELMPDGFDGTGPTERDFIYALITLKFSLIFKIDLTRVINDTYFMNGCTMQLLRSLKGTAEPASAV